MASIIDFEHPSSGELKALYETVNQVSESVEIMDAEGLLCFVNRSFEQVTGYQASEALGRSATELLASNAQDTELFAGIWATIRDGKEWHGEFEGRKRTGETYRQMVRIAPVVDNGELAYAVAIKSPIDELVITQERLRTASEHLVATGSMVVVGQLAAAMGHEINNPAQVLRSCLEHLSDRGDYISSGELSEVVSDALTALHRIETVAAELTPFSTTESEDTHPLDINTCVRHALRLAHNELRHRARVTEGLREVPFVDGLRGRLIQLITGLLVFVARTMPEDSPGNHLAVSTKIKDGDTCIELVCHLPEPTAEFDELAARIRVWEGDRAESVQAGLAAVHGTSKWIGLIFCEQIALAHGGGIEVTTSEDKCSATIEIVLPASEQVEAAAVNVLVIDDEELILRSLGRMLRREYLVDVCSSGDVALEMIAEGNYDVILCDIMMPGLSGVALYEKLATICPEAQKRIIFISAGTFTVKTQSFAEQTKQPVLLKPVRRGDLRDAIEALLVKLSL